MDAVKTALPYSGVRVLDLGQGLAGPYCAMLLAQWGADIIKVEPLQGDWLRGIGQQWGDHSALSLSANRGKRSIACDLKQPRALAAIQRIAARCDVLVESFRPGVMDRLGLGYGALSQANPALIYLSVSGFGQRGAYAQHAGSDTVLQASSGMMALNADSQGTPQRVGFLAVDTLSALYAFQAVAAALHGKLAGQGGRHLDVGLMQATAAFLAPQVVGASVQAGGRAPLAVPSGAYRTADGYLTVALSKEAQFPVLCRALGRDDLAGDARYASFALRAQHAGDLVPALRAEFAGRAVDACVALLHSHGLLAGRVNTLDQWLSDPNAAQAVTTHTLPGLPEFRMPGIPGVPEPEPGEARGAWPGIGGAAAGVLADFGFDEDEVRALLHDGVLA